MIISSPTSSQPTNYLLPLFAMDTSSRPGPDGFGPALYIALSTETKEDLMSFVNSFHGGTLDLDGYNRTHLVLIPSRWHTFHILVPVET